MAITDIASIYLYLEKRNKAGALNVLRTIYETIERIPARPSAAERTDDPTVRVKIVQKYRCKIFYSLMDNETIDILHVRHTSRLPWTMDR
jgi:toxin ParE1/3/4